MRYIPGNAQNIGSRQSQQDSFGFGELDDAAYVAHAGFLAIVCDGMGGMQHGDLASRAAVKAMLSAYRLKTASESIPAALERSTRAANQAVCELSHAMGSAEGLGTTLIACVLQETNLYWTSVGDSNAYLCRQGNIMLLNQPHVFSNLLEQAVARGTISREDADRHPERDSLTSFIGIETLEEIDGNSDAFPLAGGDTILIASDGLFKTLSEPEILAAMQGLPQNWPEQMVTRTMAAQREHQDNVTVVTVTLAAAQPGVPLAPVQVPPATPVGPTPGAGAPISVEIPAVVIPTVVIPTAVIPTVVTPAVGAPVVIPTAGAPAFEPAPEPVSKPRRMRWWPVAAVVGLLAIVAVVVFVMRQQTPRHPDSSAPPPVSLGPLPGVDPPAIDPARIVKPEPPAPDRVQVPKLVASPKKDKQTKPSEKKQ